MNNEHVSIVWTEQMRKAYGAARAVQDDKIAARMAFKEVYSRELREARANHVFPVWKASLGYDPIMREECVKQAAQKNLIGHAYAAKLIGYDPPAEEAKTQEEFGVELYEAISSCVKVQKLLHMISVEVHKGRDTADLSAQYGREKARAKQLLEADAISGTDAARLTRSYPWLLT
jgi:hypothetical protein